MRSATSGLSIFLMTALALSACGGSPETATGANGLEKSQLTIGIVPVPSSAPIFIAQQQGFFKDEGLTVKTEPIQAPQAVLPKLVQGSMDATLTSYVALLNINDSGKVPLKLIQHAQAGAPGIASVMVPKDSDIKSPKDLKGKTIGVNALKSLGETVTNAHLEENGLKPEDVKYTKIDFQQQIAALKTKQVDAIWMTEPFVSQAKAELGAVELIDTMTGPTEGIPIDAWAASDTWLKKNPKTAAALGRALAKAQGVAANREEINKVVPSFTQIPEPAVKAMKLGTFQPEVDKERFQSLADRLAGYGFLTKKVPDVGVYMAKKAE